MALHDWELQQRLATVLPLSDGELTQIITHTETLSIEEACTYFNGLLGDSREAMSFITAYAEARSSLPTSTTEKGGARQSHGQKPDSKPVNSEKSHQPVQPPAYAPPPGRPPNIERAHNHTNPVIEAARIRAIDEVCQQPLSNSN
jgi:hypothetical protein